MDWYDDDHYENYTHMFPNIEEWLQCNSDMLLTLARSNKDLLDKYSINISMDKINIYGKQYSEEPLYVVLNMYSLLHNSGGNLNITLMFPSYFLIRSLGIRCKHTHIREYPSFNAMVDSITFETY